MLLVFLYHKIGDGKYSNKLKLFENHLSYLKKRYNIVLPGEKLEKFKTNICLTFDDGYFDFYHFVFPILKKLNVKALLSIPVKYILDSSKLSPEIRSNITYKEAFNDEIYKNRAPFCTWEELNELLSSGLVQIANHSYSHKNLLEKDIDLNLEIIKSKEILEKKLNTKITTFVYPMGKFNSKIHKKATAYHKYVMRIGSSLNFHWQNSNKLTYRISSDNLKTVNQNLKFFKYISYLWFYILNKLRKR